MLTARMWSQTLRETRWAPVTVAKARLWAVRTASLRESSNPTRSMPSGTTSGRS
ncbi:Uncharacterised protein [Mycobacteroides abscessus subsp. abscessus]|nr:Uncharacterised protein [Mycobacteroides abscessus subsp. abscessus]